ncbi:Serine/threonine-protein kinase plo1 [Neolecta irregularis DAH-3]|uniref:Serine/threonine-protein kinase n=1 Tax=Neolecta irregularis (strain DAH-3) TaxID=1198029 RepID=A0A1U7LQE3_NEOID|nr:Serine/threonine-protein kinase plo1 [Neolecta irregularis DAH-3]|eukprot:OLL24803.1 Serine/threonine-protein kinase plo1 [Neolecta irregularis DAH-3]
MAFRPISTNIPINTLPQRKYPSPAKKTPKTPAPKDKHVKPSSLVLTPPTQIRDPRRNEVYQRSGCLGEGGFARCFEVQDKLGQRYAVKVIAKSTLKSSKTKQKLYGEIKVHQSMDHPNIVGFQDCFEDEVNVYMILELCENRTLMEFLRRRKRLSESEARFYLLQILGALKYMHGRKVIHRDLKLGNIFLDADMNLKIGDFGLAALLVNDTERKKTICGTPNYIAPEVLFGNQDGHSFEVDLWSVGVILYAMLVGKPPFQSKDVKAIYKKIKENRYDFPEKIILSTESKSLITSLLSHNPEHRPTIDQISLHPFFQMGPMPRSIPVTALDMQPYFERQPRLQTRQNWEFVAANSGLGNADTKVAGEVGRSVSLVVDEARQGNGILPQSLSPQNPKPKKVFVSAASNLSKKENLVQSLDNRPDSKRSLVSSIHSRPATRASSVATNLPKSQPPSSEKSIWTSVKTLTENIGLALDNPVRLPHFPKRALPSTALFITKWVDYSNRYGLGYQLSDGSVGVYFNDSTSVILSPDEHNLDYITASSSSGLRRMPCTMTSHPTELVKKVYLLKHFKGYMMQNLCKADAGSTVRTVENAGFMTHYLRTRMAIMFRFSNRSIQFNFQDHCKLILEEEGGIIRYIDKKRGFHTWTLSQAVCECPEILTKLKFARDTLGSWSSKVQAKGATSSS